MFSRSLAARVLRTSPLKRYSTFNRSSLRQQNSFAVSHVQIYHRRNASIIDDGGDQGSSTVSINTHAAMVAIFTCGVCSTRHSYQFGKQSYNEGVVIVRCPSCKNLHLMADNLKWFSDDKKNLETISKENNINMVTKKGTIEESLRSLGFTEKDATIIAKKRGSRIQLSDEVIQAIPKKE